MGKLDNLTIGLTFDDVLILPGKGGVRRQEVSLASRLTKKITLDIPILSAAMDTVTESEMAIALGKGGGLGVIHRNNSVKRQCELVREAKKGGVLVAAACGPFDLERAHTLIQNGCDVLVIDVASAHNERVIKGAKKMKKLIYPTPLIVGNVATGEAAKELFSFADAVKVGVGPGSICTTRIVTGVGVPQLSAIAWVAEVAKKRGIPVIADGGMRNPGDIAKALGAGADTVMLGNMLAGTDEASGKLLEVRGKKVKTYRGMGSLAVIEDRQASDRYFQKEAKRLIPEGVDAFVSSKGLVIDVLEDILGALRSSFGYVGAKTIEEFHERARFIRITQAGQRESAIHSILLSHAKKA